MIKVHHDDTVAELVTSAAKAAREAGQEEAARKEKEQLGDIQGRTQSHAG